MQRDAADHECPICETPRAPTLLFRPSVPVHQHLLFETPVEARQARRGDLDLKACGSCQFVFNAAFDSQLLEYGALYDNSQESSPAFSAHIDTLVERLARRSEVRRGRVVEVGCGKGEFLRRLLAHDGVEGHGVGFDPAYEGPESLLGGRLRFERHFYETPIQSDAVVCRHVIEHVDDPLRLLRTMAASENGKHVLFLETPCVEWILRRRVPWDFFYEHCSLFTAASLGFALQRAGFDDILVERVFGDQYLWAEGTTGARERDEPPGNALPSLTTFDADVQVARLSALVQKLAERGPTFVWGAGAKGATFCDMVDRDGALLAGLVDLNPAKQGRFLVGTGHPIVSPDQAVGVGMMAAVVLNPMYIGEISELLRSLGSGASVVDAMLEMSSCA